VGASGKEKVGGGFPRWGSLTTGYLVKENWGFTILKKKQTWDRKDLEGSNRLKTPATEKRIQDRKLKRTEDAEVFP